AGQRSPGAVAVIHADCAFVAQLSALKQSVFRLLRFLLLLPLLGSLLGGARVVVLLHMFQLEHAVDNHNHHRDNQKASVSSFQDELALAISNIGSYDQAEYAEVDDPVDDL